MKDRIRQLMESQHMNQQAFANRTGIATASLSNIFSERTRPTLMHVEALMKAFPTLNLQWLISGEGSMFSNSAENPAGSVNSQERQFGSAGSGQQTLAGSNANGQQGQLFGDVSGNASTDKMAEQLSLFNEEGQAKQIGQNFLAHKDTRQNPNSGQQYGAQRQAYAQSNVVAVSPTTIHRKITEIRVFYDDQTWESFIPKKN